MMKKKFSRLQSSNPQTLPPKNVVRAEDDADEEDGFIELTVSNNPSNAPEEIVKIPKSNPSDAPWKEYYSLSLKKIKSTTTTLAGLAVKVLSTPHRNIDNEKTDSDQTKKSTLSSPGGKVVLSIPHSNKNRTVSSKKRIRKLFKSFRINDQVGEYSDLKTNNNLALELFVCKICVKPKAMSEIFIIKSCRHAFCKDCVVGYLGHKLEQDITRVIGCPTSGCKSGLLVPEYCRGILPAEIFKRWRSSALPLRGIESAEFHKLNKDENEREDQENMLKNLKQWKKCPKCSFIEPADWMVCRCPKGRSILQTFTCGQI